MRDLKTLKRMLLQLNTILDSRQKIRIVIVFFVISIGSLFELLGVAALLPFLQALLSPAELFKNRFIIVLSEKCNVITENNVIILVGLLITLIYIIKNCFLIFSAYMQAWVGNTINKELSVLMLNSYMDRPYEFFVETGSGDIARGVTVDTSGVYEVIISGFKLLSEGLVIISISIYLFCTDVMLAIGIIIVGLLSILIIVLRLKKKISELSQLSRDAISKRNKWIVESIYGIKDIKVLNRKNHFVKGYLEAYENSNIANIRYTFICSLPERIIETFCVSGIIFSVLIRMSFGISTSEFVPELAVFAMGAFRLLPSISRTVGQINTFVYYRPMVESAYDNIISVRSYLSESNSTVIGADEGKGLEFSSSVVIDSIDWRYPAEKKAILEGLSFSIEKGQSIGIIGESGSGKSTLADILLRLYLPLNGSICMDGVNINSIPNSWTNTIGYVPQSVFLMNDTIRANIVFGDDKVDDDIVWKSLEQAALSEFVKSLPDGLDTIVGERGIKFSGGQRQRIAIARALYNNPQILILDEATAALDNETEESVMEAIDSLAGSMTLIIIAHRVTTLKNCDRIYEIVDGKAVERNKEEVIHI